VTASSSSLESKKGAALTVDVALEDDLVEVTVVLRVLYEVSLEEN
jgi:hypothetical protein